MEKIISITDAITGETIVREMNPAELAHLAKMLAEKEKEEAQEADNAAKKMALLDRLGMTADEAVLLLS
jgi:TorA maturation chaperone TorD